MDIVGASGGGGGTGTVTSVSVVTANGISGSVANSTTTPAITLALGAIIPTSVNSVTLSGSATPTLAVTGTSSISGANTGDNSANSSSLAVGATAADSSKLGGALPAAYALVGQTMNIGTTAVAINRAYS